MSGGVDSSVTAALLKQQGYEVLGMMLRLWSEPGKEDSNRCCTPDSMAQARHVASKLDIPFYVVDAREVFREMVVQYFLDGYAAGRTPNPCLVCNRMIRWEFLLRHAMALGAEFMATGHYARTRKSENGRIKLMRAVDPSKDQSYILHVLNQAKLQRALFPVGAYQKTEVRGIAEKLGLPTATRRDSQDLCFLAGEDYRDFLSRNAPEILRPGTIIRTDGRVLGEHNGLASYTIGQRKGLGVGGHEPLYVLRKDAETNLLVVGTQEELGRREMEVADVSWIDGEEHPAAFRADVKIRYTARALPAEVRTAEEGRRAWVVFDSPARDITAGQAAVFYNGEEVLGGGIIL